MKIVIADYPDVIARNLDYEKAVLKRHLPDVQIETYSYTDKNEFYRIIKDADALLTAFINIDADVMDHAPKLKCVSFNSTGYNFIDYDEASKRGIAIIPIAEYCTNEVADHTMALILSLSRGIKHYIDDVDKKGLWQYHSISLERLNRKTLCIFGLGKIGQAVAKRASAFGLRILAFDPFADETMAKKLHIELVDADTACEQADIITNHMRQTKENYHFFSRSKFEKMIKRPLFINTARGECVCEEDLIRALDVGIIRGAGLDVLSQEDPDLSDCKLTNRKNVIITPHAAFYSRESLEDLQRISCENAAHYLKKEYEQVFRIVNWPEIKSVVLKEKGVNKV
ncbi:NAD(P)-dependent oxidoreductase [Pectinatus sottacetonis]|uniref:NAD(P)-dependent oxidoreductase n=1 Tax=Pectinatus sottacetonis TaxID=1002795 RepID=UPI0018C4F70D|nr:NAD(P)-dependent oxidoreductase [Pectinatus sottacetonis]